MAGAAYNRGWRNMADPLPTEPCHSNVSSSPDRPEPPSGIYIYIHVFRGLHVPCHQHSSSPSPLVVPFEKIAQKTCLDKSRSAVNLVEKNLTVEIILNWKIFDDGDFHVIRRLRKRLFKMAHEFEQQREKINPRYVI